MKGFFSLLRKIWAVWALLVFSIQVLVWTPLFLLALVLGGERVLRTILWITHHIIGPITLMCCLIRLRITGQENIEKGQSYIIVSNHLTTWDIIFNAVAYPGIYRYLAKKELSRIPVFGFWVRRFCVLVDRASDQSRAKSLFYLKNLLNQGYSVFLYPEGTRNKTSEPLLPFYDGAFRMSIQTQTPLLVQVIVNIKDISYPRKSLDLRPGLLHIHWFSPLSVEGLELSHTKQLSDKTKALMYQKLTATQNSSSPA